jgi:hypothetical protein
MDSKALDSRFVLNPNGPASLVKPIRPGSVGGLRHILLNGKIKKATLDVLDMTPLKTSGLWRMAM